MKPYNIYIIKVWHPTGLQRYNTTYNSEYL